MATVYPNPIMGGFPLYEHGRFSQTESPFEFVDPVDPALKDFAPQMTSVSYGTTTYAWAPLPSYVRKDDQPWSMYHATISMQPLPSCSLPSMATVPAPFSAAAISPRQSPSLLSHGDTESRHDSFPRTPDLTSSPATLSLDTPSDMQPLQHAGTGVGVPDYVNPQDVNYQQDYPVAEHDAFSRSSTSTNGIDYYAGSDDEPGNTTYPNYTYSSVGVTTSMVSNNNAVTSGPECHLSSTSRCQSPVTDTIYDVRSKRHHDSDNDNEQTNREDRPLKRSKTAPCYHLNTSSTPVYRTAASIGRRRQRDSHMVSTANLFSTDGEEHKRHIFPCVFRFAGCDGVFKAKNEWKRHVSSMHLLERYWICHDSETPSSSQSQSQKSHAHQQHENFFNRKDLFTQHLRRMHCPAALKPYLDNATSISAICSLASSRCKTNNKTMGKTKSSKRGSQTLPNLPPHLRPVMEEWIAYVQERWERCQRVRKLPSTFRCPVPGCCSEPNGKNSPGSTEIGTPTIFHDTPKNTAWNQRMEHIAKHLMRFAQLEDEGASAEEKAKERVEFGGTGDEELVAWASSPEVGIIRRNAKGEWELTEAFKKGPGNTGSCGAMEIPETGGEMMKEEIVVVGGYEEEGDAEGEDDE